MRTKAGRIAHVRANLAENAALYAAKKRTRALFVVCKKDGARAIAEISARKP